MNKNTSIVLVATVVGIMLAGMLAVTLTTSAFASPHTNTNNGGNSANGVNGGSNAHNPCSHGEAATHNPNCQQ